MPKPVVIVGAGLAGLSLAAKLHEAGVYYLLLDASDRPGGRMKTDEVEGFKLDRGFQVMLTAYPTAGKVVDFDELDLKPFKRGFAIFDGGKTTVFDSNLSFFGKMKMLKNGVLPVADLKKAMHWTEHADAISTAEISRLRDKTADQALKEFGFSEEAMTKFARPFYGGVFMDSELTTTQRQLMFVTKMMAEGDTALPAEGIEAIPQQIASHLPKYLFRMHSRVSEIVKENGRAVGVRLDTSETIEAAAVVIATEADEAAHLTGLPTVEGFNSSTTLYFETPIPCLQEPLIVLNGSGSGLVNEVVPITQIAPSYAPAGRHLASVTIIGLNTEDDETLVPKVKAELASWFPGGNITLWRHIRTYRLRYHQMAQTPGVFASMPQNTTEVPGLFFAGEFTENSSIDGAIASGLACADAVIAEVGAVEALA